MDRDLRNDYAQEQAYEDRYYTLDSLNNDYKLHLINEYNLDSENIQDKVMTDREFSKALTEILYDSRIDIAKIY
jgi:hypothetical protein